MACPATGIPVEAFAGTIAAVVILVSITVTLLLRTRCAERICRGAGVSPGEGHGHGSRGEGRSRGGSSGGNRASWTTAINTKHKVATQKNVGAEAKKGFKRKESQVTQLEQEKEDLGLGSDDDAPDSPAIRRNPSTNPWRRRSVVTPGLNMVTFQVDKDSRPCSVYEVELTELTLLRTVGKGSYGQVYSAEWRTELVAVKKLELKCVSGVSGGMGGWG